MRIWLPDDKTHIQLDINSDTKECTVFQERFTMTLQPIKIESGFKKEEDK